MAQPVTDHPTWEYPIRQFFNDVDVNHMLQVSKGELDLSSYDHVSSKVDRIWPRIENKSMPVAPSAPWTDEMIETFKIWKNNGCPRDSQE